MNLDVIDTFKVKFLKHPVSVLLDGKMNAPMASGTERDNVIRKINCVLKVTLMLHGN